MDTADGAESLGYRLIPADLISIVTLATVYGGVLVWLIVVGSPRLAAVLQKVQKRRVG
jgi:hypothetical protein